MENGYIKKMEAKELRLGNYIYNELKQVDIVDAVRVDSSGTLSICTVNYESLWEGCYKPIPLDKDWLIKFGFENQGQWFGKRNWPHQINVNTDIGKVTIGTDQEYEVKVEYVHQLQNLYFALTGEELIQK